jgi:hypothetical protein
LSIGGINCAVDASTAYAADASSQRCSPPNFALSVPLLPILFPPAAGLIGQIFGCIIPAYVLPFFAFLHLRIYHQGRYLSPCSYYLYGRNLKRANIMFSYMISKGVVQIVVAATLLDKVSLAIKNTHNSNPPNILRQTAPHTRALRD